MSQGCDDHPNDAVDEASPHAASTGLGLADCQVAQGASAMEFPAVTHGGVWPSANDRVYTVCGCHYALTY